MDHELRGVNLDEAFQTLQQENNFFGTLNQTNNFDRFHKVRDLSLLFERNENITPLNDIFNKKDNDSEIKEFISFSEKEFNFSPKKLMCIDKNIDILIEKLKISQEKYRNEIIQIQSKIEKLRKIFNYSNEILLIDYKKISVDDESNNCKKKNTQNLEKVSSHKNEKKEVKIDNNKNTITKKDMGFNDCLEDDVFFESYKKRMLNLIEYYNSILVKLHLKINYIYNLYNLISKLVKPKFEDSKYICSICQNNTKDTFLNCGHTLCIECCKSIQGKNSKCPYCSALITNVGKLYF
tara:strand:+ start:171 stop:1052 length:882 start_codon:yes stop_codon:yes gene_type:complete